MTRTHKIFGAKFQVSRIGRSSNCAIAFVVSDLHLHLQIVICVFNIDGRIFFVDFFGREIVHVLCESAMRAFGMCSPLQVGHNLW